MKWRYVFIPTLLVLLMIRIYQKTISFDHGWFKRFYPNGFCRFYPSCSEYGYTCIERHGIFKGGWYTIIRILKCNPFHPGGIDEPPKK